MTREYTQYFTVDERERAFMDALRVIIQSGYFLAPHDYQEMLQILREVHEEDPDNEGSIMQGTNFRKDTDKRHAQVINFFFLVTRELQFF
jgi:hypothetical protein